MDGRSGLTAGDEHVAATLRRMSKRVFLVVNKAEGADPVLVGAEFQSLGLGQPHAVSAAHGYGVASLMEAVLAELPADDETDEAAQDGIRVAVVGRPNVGKSTLINRLLGEERVLVYDQAGTTRDSVYIPYERDGQRFVLIDTAGLRRRSRVEDVIEKFSVVKTLQAVEAAHVVIMVLDARDGVHAQDLTIAGMVVERGCALVIAVNKWDGLTPEQRQRMKDDIDRRLPFLNFAAIRFVSALHGTGVGNLFDEVVGAYAAAMRKLSTPELTRILNQAVIHYPPPVVRGRRIKLRYAHQGGSNPPLVVIHGNQTAALPAAYRRYLVNTFRGALHLEGTPLRLQFKTGANPYAGRKNELNKRQTVKRKRMLRHVKK